MNSLAGPIPACVFWLMAGLPLVAGVPSPGLHLEADTNSVPRYGRVEFTIHGVPACTNAFDPEELRLDLRITGPSGASLHVPGFWNQPYTRKRSGRAGEGRDWIYPAGAPQWKARFSPAELGVYRAVALSAGRYGSLVSMPVEFHCVPSNSKGFLRVAKSDPRFFETSDGSPFFAMGQNIAFVGSQQYMTLLRAESAFRQLGLNGANYVRLWTCCDDWALAIEARKSAWGRSWDWRPPIVAMPDSPTPGRKCLEVRAPGLKVDPSHPVALRPRTRYVVSARVRTEADTSLLLEINGQRSPAVASSPAATWAPFRYEFETGDQLWLGSMSFSKQGSGVAWLDGLSMVEASGGPELLWEAEVNRPARGFYNPLDCFVLDELVNAAERSGILLQLTLLTRDLYMGALKDPASAEYDHAISDAKKLLRYAVARWGYSTSVAAWEYWNEMDPGLPTDRFYRECGAFLREQDPYHHLRTTSTWGPSEKDCRHPDLDVADVHFYLRPADRNRLTNEVEAVVDRTQWLRAQASGKPAHLGEFGLADDKWRITDEMKSHSELVDVHNALWASALSGSSGTGLYWWWERLDQRGVYSLYRPLSKFLCDVPWNQGAVQPLHMSCSEPRLRTLGLQAGTRAWLWLFNPQASWRSLITERTMPKTLPGVTLELPDLPAGKYKAQWWDTTEGKTLREVTLELRDTGARMAVPDFSHDIALKIFPAP